MANLYEPEIKIFYGPKDSDHRLIPAPNISISVEFTYSNDTIIGYTYIINLQGSATALDLRSLNYGDTITDPPNYGAGAVVNHLHKIRKILVQNGNILHIVTGDNESHILRAKGGILRSFSMDESPNNWTHYASYSATLEFSSIDFGADVENCSTIFLDPTTYSANGIADIQKFKIKSFTDSWSFSFDDNESFKRVQNNDININLDIDNHSFSIEYTISAVGKHFFYYTNEDTGASKLLPAWEQAKNFVQLRLYNQVRALIGNVLKDSYNSACTSSDPLNSVLVPNAGPGLLQGLGDSSYKIFNEQITCESSESDGSFSATYSAVVKSTKGNSAWSSIETRHTVNKSIKTTNTGNKNITISINGTIEGLIEGGLIRINEPILLPSTGSFLIHNNGTHTKYDNAKILLDKIYDSAAYNGGLGANGKRDLKKLYKDALGITKANLEIAESTPDADEPPDPPHPISFNLTHDYNGGTINYSVEYSNKPCGRKFNNISIQVSNPNKVIAVFNIPNSESCPTVQELGTYSSRTVNLTIQGIDTSEMGQPANLDIVQAIKEDLDLSCGDLGYLPITMPPAGSYILTQKQYTRNPIDGSFTVNISYICNTEGCGI